MTTSVLQKVGGPSHSSANSPPLIDEGGTVDPQDGPVPPLVVTLLLDDTSQQRFDELRRRHFPPERLVVGAHVTLFHALPGDAEQRVREVLASAADRRPFPVHVTGVRMLGRGVAYDLAAPEAAAAHAQIAAAARPELTRQDAQPFRPHVTVQNKVLPEQARALHRELADAFAPWEATAVGLGLWRYLGGPWEPVATWRFPSRQA